MKYLKLFESFEDVNEICKKYDIKDYTINTDGSIDVNASVNLLNEKLTKLPLKFNKVNGSFYCYKNELTSLKGSPKKVGGDFYCSYNILTSLKGSPESVRGSFYCSYNKISSLKGCPKYIGMSFVCFNNPLESLEGYDGEYHKFFCTNKKKLIRKEKIRIINNI